MADSILIDDAEKNVNKNSIVFYVWPKCLYGLYKDFFFDDITWKAIFFARQLERSKI